MTRSIFGLDAGGSDAEWRLPVTKAMCVGTEGSQFMLGGIGLGAALVALERHCGRPVIWASAQFFAHVRQDDIVDLRIDVPVSGKGTSQARVSAHTEGREIYCVNAALGLRDHPVSQQGVHAPTVPAPGQPAEPFVWSPAGAALRQAIDIIPAPILGEASAPNRTALWMRARGGALLDIGWLAIYADFATIGIETTLGPEWKASSIDNTVRIRRMMATEWVLCDIMIQGVHAGIAHGEMRMFAPDGDLIAIASQSMILRRTG